LAAVASGYGRGFAGRVAHHDEEGGRGCDAWTDGAKDGEGEEKVDGRFDSIVRGRHRGWEGMKLEGE